jgi:hypothetical protein
MTNLERIALILLVVALSGGFDTNRSRDEERANARLIAAAPDLLKALECIASFESKYATSSPAVTVAIITDIARVAIAKARGE